MGVVIPKLYLLITSTAPLSRRGGFWCLPVFLAAQSLWGSTHHRCRLAGHAPKLRTAGATLRQSRGCWEVATSLKKRQGSFRAASFFSFPEDDGDGDDNDDDDDGYEGCFFSPLVQWSSEAARSSVSSGWFLNVLVILKYFEDLELMNDNSHHENIS